MQSDAFAIRPVATAGRDLDGNVVARAADGARAMVIAGFRNRVEADGLSRHLQEHQQ